MDDSAEDTRPPGLTRQHMGIAPGLPLAASEGGIEALRGDIQRLFDIEAIKQANADLIATIEESLSIADEGKARRAAAEGELVKMEHELRDTLSAARARNTRSVSCWWPS